MATKPAQQNQEPTAFLKEVDDFLHYEKMTELWKKYKLVLYIGVATLFITVGGATYYNQQQEVALLSQATNWWKVTQAKTPEEAKKAINYVINNNAFGYRMLGRIALAKEAYSKNNIETALTELRALQADKNADVLYKDMAAFFEGQILMTTNPTKAKTIFTTLDNSKSPFQVSSLEMLALMAENTNIKTDAVALYERIVEFKDITPNMRNRAETRLRKITKTKAK